MQFYTFKIFITPLATGGIFVALVWCENVSLERCQSRRQGGTIAR
jgi:hypothetical protein